MLDTRIARALDDGRIIIEPAQASSDAEQAQVEVELSPLATVSAATRSLSPLIPCGTYA